MMIIKNYWEKFKKTKIYMWYKSLPVSVVGLTTFLAILVFLTAIFNWFWTGTGSDPTRTFYAPFTNDFKEFQEYATLYIALLAFGATMFAGLAVFLVFNDWKEQHNKTVYSDLAKEYLNQFENIFYQMLTIDRHYNECKVETSKLIYIPNVSSKDTLNNRKLLEKEIYSKLSIDFSESLSKILIDLNKIVQRITVFTVLSKNKDLLESAFNMNKKLCEIEKEITEMTITNTKLSPIEFMDKIENYNIRIFSISEDYMVKIINILKGHIEA